MPESGGIETLLDTIEAGWDRIKELEGRLTAAVLEIAWRREGATPEGHEILDAIEAPLLGWDSEGA